MARGKGIPAFPQPNRQKYDPENEAEFRRMILEALSDLGAAIAALGDEVEAPDGRPEFLDSWTEGAEQLILIRNVNARGDETIEVWVAPTGADAWVRILQVPVEPSDEQTAVIPVAEPEERALQEDFEAPEPVERGASAAPRPDAVALDPRVAFATGPRALNDISRGLEVRPWRLRYEDGAYLVSNFQSETVVFTSEEDAPDAVSLAFDQGGQPVIAAEIDGVLWVYRFDPINEVFVFEELGPGRNPRLYLDRPYDIPTSDVQLFYINDGYICHRIQRELYDTENRTPAEVTENDYLEAVYRSGIRLNVVWSTHDPATGEWSFGGSLSALADPAELFTDAMRVASEVLSVTSYDVVEPLTTGTEALAVVGVVLAVRCTEPIVFETLTPEALSVSSSILLLRSLEVLRYLSFPEVEALGVSSQILAASSRAVVVGPVEFTEAMSVSSEMLSVSCLEA